MTLAPIMEASLPQPKVRNLRYPRKLTQIIDDLKALVDVEFQKSPFRSLNNRFVIAADGRTGSWVLCERLLTHGVVVREFFQTKQIELTCQRENIDRLEKYCEFVVKHFAFNGVFGVKGPIQVMGPLSLAGEIPGFLAEWKFIYLKRNNVVQQAISEVIAKTTGAYRSSKRPRQVLTDEDFDGARIARTVKQRLSANATWEAMFDALGIEPLRLSYEELAADPDATAAVAAAYLGLRGPPITDERFLSPPLQVQATELNARWERRFHDDGWQDGATVA